MDMKVIFTFDSIVYLTDVFIADAKPKKLNAQAKKLKTKVKGIFAISQRLRRSPLRPFH